MATIISCKNHVNDDGTYSGLRVTRAMAAATTQLTGARLGDLLLKLFKPLTEAPTEILMLEPMYKTHKEALTSLMSLDIDLHPVLQCFMLQQMAHKLAAKSEHNLILGIPMAAIVQTLPLLASCQPHLPATNPSQGQSGQSVGCQLS